MARRRRDLREEKPPVDAVDELAVRRRYRRLRTIGLAIDPPPEGETAIAYELIRTRGAALDRDGQPIADRLAELEEFAAGLDLA